ncbi:hypothetical protein PENTCL1PPCAC_18665, partial [Pristionchus entomophagus]
GKRKYGCCISLKSSNPLANSSSFQRVLRTGTTEKINCKLDFNDPLHRNILDLLNESGVNSLSVGDVDKESRAIISSLFIESLPWKGHFAASPEFNLFNIRIAARDMRKLYEKSRDSYFKRISFDLPMCDSVAFGQQVLGINDFSFSKSKKFSMTTSLQHEKVYSTFRMMDAQRHISRENRH